MTRVALDSNVLIAAFAARGLCADLLRQVLLEYRLLIPHRVVEECRRVLKAKLELSPTAMEAFDSVIDRCEILPSSGHSCPVHVRDPDDERILADAIAGGAEVLVTGDADLLSVAAEAPIPILSPRAFMTLSRRPAI